MKPTKLKPVKTFIAYATYRKSTGNYAPIYGGIAFKRKDLKQSSNYNDIQIIKVFITPIPPKKKTK